MCEYTHIDIYMYIYPAAIVYKYILLYKFKYICVSCDESMMMKLKFEIVIVRVKNPTSRIANYFLHTDTVMVYRPYVTHAFT